MDEKNLKETKTDMTIICFVRLIFVAMFGLFFTAPICIIAGLFAEILFINYEFFSMLTLKVYGIIYFMCCLYIYFFVTSKN